MKIIIDGTNTNDSYNKITHIKLLRKYIGLGLKEAKELSEQCVDFPTEYPCEGMTVAEYNMMAQELGTMDVRVVNTEYNKKYVEPLQELATAATLAGDYYVAKIILSTLEKL